MTLEAGCDGRILLFDAACQSVTGYSAAEAVGRPMWDFMTVPEEVLLVKLGFDGLCEGRFPKGFIDHWQTKSGAELVIVWSATVVHDARGQVERVVCKGRDITDANWSVSGGLSPWNLLNQIPAVVWTVDKDLRVSASIGAGLSGFGLKTGQLEGTSLYEFLHTGDPGQITVIRHRRALAGETVRHETEWLGRWFQSVIQPLRDARGEIKGAIGIALDITERKHAEEELHQAVQREQVLRHEAERLSRLKDEFLIMLSHELRTPLMPILGWADLLLEGSLEPTAARNGLKAIERNARVELQLIEDLLDVSRIVAGKLHLDAGTVDLLPVVKAAIEVVSLAAEAKHIGVELEADECSYLVTGDAKRLQQVVWNLVSNAVKFTPSDGRVGVRLERDGAYAKIAVVDNGIGIDPDFLPHVFERFRQEDSSASRRAGGLGIGLALARLIVEAHGGSISAASPGPGRGATFTVALPIRAA
jgi:PAS domain S-box-containing protein